MGIGGSGGNAKYPKLSKLISLLLLSSSKKIYLIGVHSQGAWIHMLDDIIIVTFGFEQVEV